MAIRSVTKMHHDIELRALDEDGYREIGLIWRKNSSHDAEFRLFGEYVKAVFSGNNGTRIDELNAVFRGLKYFHVLIKNLL